MLEIITRYGPIPPTNGIPVDHLFDRLVHDKKAVQGTVYFVLPVRIGEVKVVSGVPDRMVLDAIQSALAA